MNTVDKTITGLMSRNPTEIARVLDKARNQGVYLTAFFPNLTFQALLVHVDPRGGRIVMEKCADERANRILLARPRCAFHCDMAGWHVEFIAAEPREVTVKRRELIQCRFPELLASNPRRLSGRASTTPLAMRVVADADGIMPFEAVILDLAVGGIAFMVYGSGITLEPGTVLRGCQIVLPNGKACTADLEVRYTQSVTLNNGKRANRSGCRFVTASPELLAFVERYLS